MTPASWRHLFKYHIRNEEKNYKLINIFFFIIFKIGRVFIENYIFEIKEFSSYL